ncbi:S41 family peptidase [Pseudoalteromonas sp. A25]|uniref:S41 family peptidase n=1 Tax=Pseudoalteromonas sp. A25 TaxID=116092 RepID=UPI00156285DE|nr:S41 family peptidase [Pseudoalteromonas sp. A25]
MKRREAWEGWSIKTFWHDSQNNKITRIQFQPAAPYFDGKVYVLISKNTASAGELAADALLAAPHVTLIGETTAGEMLSQKMYDVTGGLQIFLPIADYYSVNSGRIEGNGVKPHICVPANDAMDVALSMISDCSLN